MFNWMVGNLVFPFARRMGTMVGATLVATGAVDEGTSAAVPDLIVGLSGLAIDLSTSYMARNRRKAK